MPWSLKCQRFAPSDAIARTDAVIAKLETNYLIILEQSWNPFGTIMAHRRIRSIYSIPVATSNTTETHDKSIEIPIYADSFPIYFAK